MAPRPNLPHPWLRKWSNKKRKFYFLNPVTKTIQWTAPVSDPPIVQNAAASVNLPGPTLRTGSKVLQLSHESKSIIHSDENAVQQDVTTEGIEMPHTSTTENPAVVLSSVEKTTTKSSSTKPVEIAEGPKLQKRKHGEDVGIPSKELKKAETKRVKVHSKVDLAQGMPNIMDEQKEEDEEMENSRDDQLIFDEIEMARDVLYKNETQVFRLHTVKTHVEKTAANMATAPPQSHSHKLWLVLDTSILLKEIRLLKALKLQLTEQFNSDFSFVVPWVVFNELDHIKECFAPKTPELKNRARSAINTIGKWYDGNDPHIIGQDARKAASLFDVKNGFVVEKNDDKILHCCLQLHDNHSSHHVALYTLDTNLRNKCRSLGITSFNEKKLTDWLKAVAKTTVDHTATPVHRCFSDHAECTSEVVVIPMPGAAEADTSVIPALVRFVPATSGSEESLAESTGVVNKPPSDMPVEGPSSGCMTTVLSAASIFPIQDNIPKEPGAMFDDKDKLRRVFELFDLVLMHLRMLRAHVREELLVSSVYGTNRPLVIQSFMKLQRCVARILNQFERLMSEHQSIGISPVYLDLLSAVFAFRDEFNLKLPSVDCREVRLFFEDSTKRDMLAKGLLQFKEIESAVIDSQRLLTPAEKWCLFEKD